MVFENASRVLIVNRNRTASKSLSFDFLCLNWGHRLGHDVVICSQAVLEQVSLFGI